MNRRGYLIVGLSVAAVSFLVFWAGMAVGSNYERKRHFPVPSDTIRIERIDTVRIVERVTDTVTAVELRPYYVALHDTVTVADSVWVELPYERRHFVKPDTLEVWYSGFDPHLDSAIIYNRHTTEIVNHVIEANKMPRLTFDIGAAAAYHERKVCPFAVADLRYNAPRVTWGAFGAIDPQGRWAAGLSATYRLDIIK